MNPFELLSFGPDGWGSQLASGTWLTVRLALATLPFGLSLGLLLAIAINGRNSLVSRVATGFATVFRALPELLTIFIIYYGAQFGLERLASFAFPGMQVQVNGFVAGMAALGVVFASFASEVFVSAMRAVPRGQVEAARSIGLSPRTTFLSVVLPQLWRIALPGLGNLWFVLLKDTALVSVIALSDLMRQTTLAVANTKQPLLFYATMCGIYLVLSLVSGSVIRLLERRANVAYRSAR